MTQPSIFRLGRGARVFFMTSALLKAQLDVDTTQVATATVAAVQAGEKIPSRSPTSTLEDIQSKTRRKTCRFC